MLGNEQKESVDKVHVLMLNEETDHFASWNHEQRRAAGWARFQHGSVKTPSSSRADQRRQPGEMANAMFSLGSMREGSSGCFSQWRITKHGQRTAPLYRSSFSREVAQHTYGFPTRLHGYGWLPASATWFVIRDGRYTYGCKAPCCDGWVHAAFQLGNVANQNRGFHNRLRPSPDGGGATFHQRTPHCRAEHQQV